MDTVEQAVIRSLQWLNRLRTDASGPRELPHHSDLYEEVVAHGNDLAKESPAPEDALDPAIAVIAKFYNQRLGGPASQPPTMRQLRQMFTANPELNRRTPFHFQSGPATDGGWVHMEIHQALGVERVKSGSRIYLNPRSSGLGEVVTHLATSALREGVPIAFKFNDLATNPSPTDLTRSDRVVIWLGPDQLEYGQKLVRELLISNREDFVGRTSEAGFARRVTDGVSEADDITDRQLQLFKERYGTTGRESFNSFRSRMLFVALESATRELVWNQKYASLQYEGKPLRAQYVASLDQQLARTGRPPLTPGQIHGMIDDGRLHVPTLRRWAIAGVPVGLVNQLNRAVMRDFLPVAPAEVVRPLIEHHVRVEAQALGVDPANLAQSAPELPRVTPPTAGLVS